MLRRDSSTEIEATDYDPASIMLYMFGAGLFADGKGGTNQNHQISALDKKMIAELYPLGGP